MSAPKPTEAQRRARDVARDWRNNPLRALWSYVNSDLILDSLCMDEVRCAWSAAEARRITADYVVEFRAALIESLAAKGYHTDAGRAALRGES